MRRTQYRVGGSGWQGQAIGCLQQVLPLAGYGRILRGETIARVLLWISLTRSTGTFASQRLPLGVSDETLRQAIHASLPEVETLPRLLNVSLIGQLSKLRRSRRKRGFDIAIDVHHRPYYGQPLPGLFRGQAKSGTKRFWSTATAAIVHRGERLTIAIASVTSNRMEDVLNALWPQIQQIGLKVGRLLLDRGFYSAEVVAWLHARGVAFIMPMIRRGRPPRKGNLGTGTAPFFVRGRRGITTHTWQQRKRDRRVTVTVVIVPHRDRRRGPLVYVCGGRVPSLDYCQWLYKKRFGIETTYRQANQSRGWTTSPDVRLRRLLIALSFLLLNLWTSSRPTIKTERPERLTFLTYLTTLEELIRTALSQPPRGPPDMPYDEVWIY